jgi:hypothetical protein
MIIGVNGKIGSGKDTVGSIIQYLTANDVGSDCIKRIRGGLPIYGYHNSKWEVKKFAGKLKQIASLLTGVPVEMFEDQEFKKTDLPNEWVYVKPGYPARNMTVREFLQRLGTDAMRDNLHENVWVNALFADYVPRLQFEKSFHGMKGAVPVEEPNWIITDMRFPNEMEAVKEKKGITIRVVRPKIETEEFKPLHPSETALDDAKFNYEIVNDGSIDDLIEKVKEILIKERII